MILNADEVVLATLPGTCESEQLLVVMVHTAGGNRLELRQQSWGEGVGWFTQSTVQLAPHQVGELRGVLGASGAARPKLPAAFSRRDPSLPLPRIVRADSA